MPFDLIEQILVHGTTWGCYIKPMSVYQPQKQQSALRLQSFSKTQPQLSHLDDYSQKPIPIVCILNIVWHFCYHKFHILLVWCNLWKEKKGKWLIEVCIWRIGCLPGNLYVSKLFRTYFMLFKKGIFVNFLILVKPSYWII